MGRKLPVDLSLIKDLSVDVKESEESVDLMVVGSIMESAKIFEKLVVRERNGKILLTVLASLAFWNRAGGPDFHVAHKLAVPPGAYEVLYDDQNGKTTFLKGVSISKRTR
ncbi:MAG TPA: hypothetical protein VFE33_09780 [Thermoanaerobaculia bacterium]|nr:hypothetical protein [Thermoanaerobaculia bacterium]